MGGVLSTVVSKSAIRVKILLFHRLLLKDRGQVADVNSIAGNLVANLVCHHVKRVSTKFRQLTGGGRDESIVEKKLEIAK